MRVTLSAGVKEYDIKITYSYEQRSIVSMIPQMFSHLMSLPW